MSTKENISNIIEGIDFVIHNTSDVVVKHYLIGFMDALLSKTTFSVGVQKEKLTSKKQNKPNIESTKKEVTKLKTKPKPITEEAKKGKHKRTRKSVYDNLGEILEKTPIVSIRSVPLKAIKEMRSNEESKQYMIHRLKKWYPMTSNESRSSYLSRYISYINKHPSTKQIAIRLKTKRKSTDEKLGEKVAKIGTFGIFRKPLDAVINANPNDYNTILCNFYDTKHIYSYTSAYKRYVKLINSVGIPPEDVQLVRAKMVSLWRSDEDLTLANLKKELPEYSQKKLSDCINILIKKRLIKMKNNKFEIVFGHK